MPSASIPLRTWNALSPLQGFIPKVTIPKMLYSFDRDWIEVPFWVSIIVCWVDVADNGAIPRTIIFSTSASRGRLSMKLYVVPQVDYLRLEKHETNHVSTFAQYPRLLQLVKMMSVSECLGKSAIIHQYLSSKLDVDHSRGV